MNLLKRIKLALITDVPPHLNTCEWCRELECDNAKAAKCELKKANDRYETVPTRS